MIKAVVFDFGGVLATEGFKEGLKAIGRKNGLDPDEFFLTASELVYQTGYVAGMSGEPEYWKAIRERTGVTASDEELRNEILSRFSLRPKILSVIRNLRDAGMSTAVLSDQTNWLNEINSGSPFYHNFDFVFNSFELKKTKRDSSVFRDICSAIGVEPGEVLFIDDNVENIRRAKAEGLIAMHFKDVNGFEKEIEKKIQEER